MLEVLRSFPARATKRPPVVFVHGAYVGAWCWGERFLPHFARRGYHCHALSLRGHGGSPCDGLYSLASVEDYVSDIAEVVAGLEAPPVLVGHSMGAHVVARYLSRTDAAAGVLLAPVPVDGLSPAVVSIALRAPLLLAELNLIQFSNPLHARLDEIRRALFSPDVDDATVRGYFRRMQPESQRALVEMSVLHLLPRLGPLRPPTLVLAAANDGFFAPASVRATAGVYGAECEVLDGLAHAMMLEHRWKAVADRVIDWIEATIGF